MAQFEHDDLLHSKVVLDPRHSLRFVGVLESVVVLAIEAVHDILLKVLQEVHFRLRFLRLFFDGEGFPHVDGPVSPRSDCVKVTEETLARLAKTERERLTVCLHSE